MYLDTNKYLFVFIGWLIRVSYQLDCLQCTSHIRRISQSWDHSCLDGTLIPLPCYEPPDALEPTSKQCVSALYRVGQRGMSGVLIYRGCTNSSVVQRECDPPGIPIDFDRKETFYCSQTCSNDGCNRHLVHEIKANTSKLSKNKFTLLLLLLYLIFLFIFRCNLYS